jgi:hypothetical protein
MKPQWDVSRAVVAHADGQRRWDYAYQFLLRWMMDHLAGAAPALSHPQEDQDGNRIVCAGLNQSPAASPDN